MIGLTIAVASLMIARVGEESDCGNESFSFIFARVWMCPRGANHARTAIITVLLLFAARHRQGISNLGNGFSIRIIGDWYVECAKEWTAFLLQRDHLSYVHLVEVFVLECCVPCVGSSGDVLLQSVNHLDMFESAGKLDRLYQLPEH
jgi:hypothetical protein